MADNILRDKAVKEFKEIYKKDHGIELSNGDAFELVHKFFNMMQVVYRPIPGKDYEVKDN